MIYILNKVGYSAGVYGCSGEYFTLTIIKDSESYKTINFSGLYGSEDRVTEPLKNKGYKDISSYHRYGQLKGDERKGFMSEQDAIKEVEEFIK